MSHVSPPVDLLQLEEDLLQAARLATASILHGQLRLQFLEAPHRRPPNLPAGQQAAYAFFLGSACLKVGKAGPKTRARFTTQHYGFNAPSTLARSIDANREMVNGLIPPPPGAVTASLPDRDVLGEWIERNTSRLHVFLPVSSGKFALAFLEAFLQCRLRPIFEGKAP